MNVDTARASWDLRKKEAMVHAFQHVRLPLCITDPVLPDNPIVFVNDAFVDLTGYPEDEIIGRNCRFLQGANTSEESVQLVRSIIERRAVETVEIVNYRRDGSEFLNALQLGPIYDDNGRLVFYFGSQLDISAKRAAEEKARVLANRELLHRLNNIANVMMAIIRMTAREERDSHELGEILIGRLTALCDAHFATLRQDQDGEADLEELARSILSATAPLGEHQFSLEGPRIMLPRHILTPVTLSLHELAINAVKHGALGAEIGHVNLSWQSAPAQEGTGLIAKWDESGGPETTVPERQSGSSIITTLVAASGGSLDFDWREEGLRATLQFQL